MLCHKGHGHISSVRRGTASLFKQNSYCNFETLPFSNRTMSIIALVQALVVFTQTHQLSYLSQRFGGKGELLVQ